jgi:serine/threonine protein kinase
MEYAVREFDQLLDDLLQGKSSLAPLRAWLEERLKQSDCDTTPFSAAIERAQQAGLSQPLVMALRKQIETSRRPEVPPPEKHEPTKTITSVTVTQTETRPNTTGTGTTLPLEHTKTDTDQTLTAPATDQNAVTDTGNKVAPTPDSESERTVMLSTTDSPDEDKTTTDIRGRSRRDAGEYDPFSPDSTSVTSGEATHVAMNSESGKKSTQAYAKVGPGSVLKERFELVNVLGEGGMGKVYRARDLLKVEAKDKNPFIAVKTLSGDFRQHPEAFMALQREASKAQRLAHPNIATVFDFDRDGSTIYLTMELMEGEELSSFIKRLPAGGLPVPEAMKLIKQLCDGLGYAHAKGLVHSDFKPGNAFITSDGTVKLLDFGIARASKTRHEVSGVITIFDPSELGALTPAYASLEMFEGEDPDPRDDIYALACVAYELLTGKHPFNKLSAPKILEKGLRPAPIAKLNKRQNRALLNALAINREDRTPTVEEFWDGLRPKTNRVLQFGPYVLLLLILLVVLGYKPVEGYLRTRRNNDIVNQIQSGNTDVPAVLKLISGFDPESQRFILENGKDKIIKYFEAQAEAFVDQAHGQYNYPAALDEIARASQYFSDSAELAQEKSSLKSRQANLVAELTGEFNARLSAGQILPGTANNITDVIRILRTADPNNAFLHDERLINQYAQLARKDAQAGNYAAATTAVAAGLDYAPDDADLLNLQDQIQRSLRQQRNAPRVSAVDAQLQSSAPGLHTLADYAAIRADMLDLVALNPDDPLLRKLSISLAAAVQTAIAEDIANHRWANAEQSLIEYAPLLSLDEVMSQRAGLSRAEASADYKPADLEARSRQVQAQRTTISQLLAKPQYSPDWDNQVMQLTLKTAALLQTGGMDWFRQLRDSIATAYVSLARQMIKQNRFDAASHLLNTGAAYAPQLPAFANIQQSLVEAKQKFSQLQAERLRNAQTVALESQFQIQLNAGQIGDARQTYALLQNRLPLSDKFFTTDAPAAYANAYLNLAKARAATGDYRGSIALVNGGLQYAALPSLKKALQEYRADAERGDLLAMVNNLQPQDMDHLKDQLLKVQQLLPAEQMQISNQLFRRLALHIEELKGTDLRLANELLNAAKSSFPQSLILKNMSLPPPPPISRFATLGRAAMTQAELSRAQSYFDQGQQTESGNPDLVQFGKQLQAAQAYANRYFQAYQEFMRAGQAQQAKAYLVEAMHLWTDNPAFQAEYQRNFAVTPVQVKSPNGGKPCTADLAGYGQQQRAECYDLLGNGLRGPTLVVVPAGGGFKQPFAIGKYEVSAAQFNAFCAATGQCKALPGDGNLPATDIPYSRVKAYVNWLSAKSDERYFIPSYAQYRYAASVGGSNTNRDFNCQVTLSGRIIKGLTVVSIETGRANAWGLVNYVGNVQEWVLGSEGLEAVGGSYRDPLALCSVDLTRPSSGAPDPLTGFRVARYLDK